MPPVIVTETHRKEEWAEPHGQKERVNLAKMKRIPSAKYMLRRVFACDKWAVKIPYGKEQQEPLLPAGRRLEEQRPIAEGIL